MSASFPAPAPGPFATQSPVYPQAFNYPSEPYQLCYPPTSAAYPSMGGPQGIKPSFDPRQNGYAYPSPAGGVQLMSPNSNVPFGHPMRQFHQPGLPQPAGTMQAQMQMHNHMGQNGQMVANVPLMMSTGQTMPMTSTTQMMTQRPPSESGPPAQSPMAGVPARPPSNKPLPSPGSNRLEPSLFILLCFILILNGMYPVPMSASHQKPQNSPSHPSTTLQSTQGQIISSGSGGAVNMMSPSGSQTFNPNMAVPSHGHKESLPPPPTLSTPYTTVTHYDMPPAFTQMRETFQRMNPALIRYYERRKTPLPIHYPTGQTQAVAANEPPTFAFIPDSKYYEMKYDRGISVQGGVHPSHNGQIPQPRSQMPNPQLMSPVFPQPPMGKMKPPAKKSRTDSGDGYVPILPSGSMMSGPMIGGPSGMPMGRPMPNMPYVTMGGSHMGGPMSCFPGSSQNGMPIPSSAANNSKTMSTPNGIYMAPNNGMPIPGVQMNTIPSNTRHMNGHPGMDIPSQMADSKSQNIPVSRGYQCTQSGQMYNGEQQQNSIRTQMPQNMYTSHQPHSHTDPQCPVCRGAVAPTNQSIQCNGVCRRLFHQVIVDLIFAILLLFLPVV
uniref:LITAF domain-containing protein n=1 Tax=Heterorhabditis bacteriophora TaxID=37862 RepID=A0A1I7XNG2_HETBA